MATVPSLPSIDEARATLLAVARPLPTGSSITAAVPPSSSAPRAKPETNQSPEAAGGNSTATCSGADAVMTLSYS